MRPTARSRRRAMRHLGWLPEYSGAGDATHHDHGGVEQPELAPRAHVVIIATSSLRLAFCATSTGVDPYRSLRFTSPPASITARIIRALPRDDAWCTAVQPYS